MKKFLMFVVVASMFSTPAMAIDIAISTRAGWWPQGNADREMQEVVDMVTAVDVTTFTPDSEDALATWVAEHTGDGGSDLLIMNGQFPSTIYAAGNAQTDGSLAELFLDDGNCIINTGDYMFYVVNGAGANATGGLQNMMDVPAATMWNIGSPMVPTPEAAAITPSLVGGPITRPWHLDQFDGTDWVPELILRSDGGVGADPAIMINTVTGGRLGTFFQIASAEMDLRGEVISEWINNWYLKNVSDPSLASGPNPTDGEADVSRDAALAWSAGQFAATHNVYLGTAYDDVNMASAGLQVGDGLGDASLEIGRLDFGETYFWKVDEVNAAPDFTTYDGTVWSFTVEPIAYPITSVTATASTSQGASGPENTINGSGLADDLHGTISSDMWLSLAIPATIEYAFDGAYKLHELWIWNSNQSIESFIGFGAKDVVIEYSLDGATWTVLEGVGPLAQATGAEGYAHNNVIDFGGAVAQHVRITVNSVQGFAPVASLSEVRFFSTPTLATRPDPADGDTNVSPFVTLAWGRNGREAGSHEVYVGTDAGDMASAGSTGASSLSTGALDLALGTTYSWRVDEVNDTMDPSTWTGTVWSFTTSATITVDSMDGYKDEELLEPWASWIDGFGDAGNGALIGNGATGSPETGIVHGGSQSLPFYYGNSAAAQSEAKRTFTPPMDWTGHGVQSLSLYFHGDAANSGGKKLYVKINNKKILYDGDPDDLNRSQWQPWNIDLSAVGGNLSSVSSMTLGVEGGGMGVVYIDDIELYPSAPEFIVPAEPDAANLVARFNLDGNANDSSGNGHNGSVVGAVTYGNDADRGQVIVLPGGDDQYISIEGVGISGNMPRTIACWAKADNTNIPNWTLIFGFTGTTAGGGGSGSHFNIGSLGGPGGVGAHVWGWEETIFSDTAALEWHHYAMTYDGTTIAYYGDGIAMDTDLAKSNVQDLATSSDRVHIGSRITQTSSFPGSVDDAVIYSVELSDGEIAWLAGRTVPMHKAF